MSDGGRLFFVGMSFGFSAAIAWIWLLGKYIDRQHRRRQKTQQQLLDDHCVAMGYFTRDEIERFRRDGERIKC